MSGPRDEGTQGGDAGASPPASGAGLRRTVQGLWWALLSGVLVFTAFPFRTAPDSGLWPLAWIGLVPLLWALREAGLKRAFLYGWAMGLVTSMGGFWWVAVVVRDFGHLPSAVAWGVSTLNAAYQGVQFALFALLLVVLRRPDGRRPGPWATAALFTAVEWLYPLIFPWHLGNCQQPFRPAMQVAELTGIAGVTFLVALANAAVAEGVDALADRRPFRGRTAAAAVLLVAVALGWGTLRAARIDERMAEAPSLKVGMVEADIGIFEKQARGLSRREMRRTRHGNLLVHQRMSRRVVERGAELVVWPESSYLPLGDVFTKRLDAFAAGVRADGRIGLWRDADGSGATWTEGPETPTPHRPLRAAAAPREDALLAAGDGGRLLRWDGRAVHRVPLREVPRGGPPDLRAVAATTAAGRPPREATAPLRIWAGGAHGALYTGDTDGLHPVTNASSETVRALALSEPERGVGVTARGTLLALDGEGARPAEPDVDVELDGTWRDVWADPRRGRAWAVGPSDHVLRRDARGWTAVAVPGSSRLRAVTGARGRLWAVGDDGVVLRRGGDGRWARERVPGEPRLVAVTVGPRGHVLAAGAEGGLWRRPPPRAEGAPEWTSVEREGSGPIADLAGLSWLRTRHIPRDVQYLYQSDRPVPSAEAYDARPHREFTRPPPDRTAVQRGYRAPVLFGAITAPVPDEAGGADDRPPPRYNTMLLADRTGRVVGRFDKIHLLAFGEYIPFGETFPVLYEWLPQASRFRPGEGIHPIEAPGLGPLEDSGEASGLRIGPMICYEDILPGFAANLAQAEPDLLVNLTNDAWFGLTSEPRLHLQLATVRAVEQRRTLVRSTNTGVSAIIDPTGRMMRRTAITGRENVVEEVPLLERTTLFDRVGNLFAWIVVAWAAVLVTGRVVRRRRARSRASGRT